MVSEVVSALMEIVNWPPLITAPSTILMGILLLFAVAVSIAEVLTCV